MKRLAVTVLIAIACVARASAWGVQGHHIVAGIAASLLTPATRQAVDALLGSDGLVPASTWADEIRSARPETYNWHFVDIPYGNTTYRAERDCLPSDRGDCLIAELLRAQKALRDTAAERTARVEALKFVVHFVGDLHQPLHTIDNADRGGNDTRVEMSDGRISNLHAIWDSVLIQSRGLDDAANVARLTRDLLDHPIDAGPIDFAAWAQASHAVAVETIYTFPEFVAGSPPKAPIHLAPAYFDRGMAVSDRQLQLAGVRLAAVLNDALGDRRDPRAGVTRAKPR